MALNYYALNKIIGGRMVPRSPVRFGHSRLLDTVGAAMAAQRRTVKNIPFDYDMDRTVWQAFEQVREGSAPERVMWDPAFGRKFHSLARKLGVHAPARQLNRRLLTIRKNPGRYQEQGIVLSPTTVTNPQPSIVSRYAHVIEFALVKLRNRHGASIDDVLLDPDLAQEYEGMVRHAAPAVTAVEARLGALYIRKTRFLARSKIEHFASLDVRKIEREIRDVGALNRLAPTKVPAGEGLLEVLEEGKHLYVARNEDLRSVAEEFASGQALTAVANEFWSPRLETIHMRIIPGACFDDQPIGDWQLKLIHEYNPVFNWPVLSTAA